MKSTIKADKIIKLKNKNIKKNDYEIDYNKNLILKMFVIQYILKLYL